MPFLPSRTLDRSGGLTSFGMKQENENAAIRAYKLVAEESGLSPEQLVRKINSGKGKAPGATRLAKKDDLVERIKKYKLSEAAKRRFKERTNGKGHAGDEWFNRVADNFHADMEYKSQQKKSKGQKNQGGKNKNKNNSKKDKKEKKKSERKKAKRNRVTMIEKAYTAAPELKGQQHKKNRMTAIGHLMAMWTENPYMLGGNKADVFKEVNFDPTIGFGVLSKSHQDAIALCDEIVKTSHKILRQFPNGAVRAAAYDALGTQAGLDDKLFKHIAQSFERNVVNRMDMSKHKDKIKNTSIYSLGLTTPIGDAILHANTAQCSEDALVTVFQTFRYLRAVAHKLASGFKSVQDSPDLTASLTSFIVERYSVDEKDATEVKPEFINANSIHAQFKAFYQLDMKVFNFTYRILQKMLYIVRHPQHASILQGFKDSIIGLFDKDPAIRVKATTLRSTVFAHVQTILSKGFDDAVQTRARVSTALQTVLNSPVSALEQIGITETLSTLLFNVKLSKDAGIQRPVWNAIHSALAGDKYKDEAAIPASGIHIKTFETTGNGYVQNIIAQYFTKNAVTASISLYYSENGQQYPAQVQDVLLELKIAASFIRKSRKPNFVFEHPASILLTNTTKPLLENYGVLGLANSLSMTSLPIQMPTSNASGSANPSELLSEYGLTRLNWVARLLGLEDSIVGYSTSAAYNQIPTTTYPGLVQIMANNATLYKKADKAVDEITAEIKEKLRVSRSKGGGGGKGQMGVLHEVVATPLQPLANGQANPNASGAGGDSDMDQNLS